MGPLQLTGQQRTSLRAFPAYTYSKFYVGYCAACIRLLHEEDVRWVFIVHVKNQLTSVKWGFLVVQRDSGKTIVCKDHTTGNSIGKSFETIVYPGQTIDEELTYREKGASYPIKLWLMSQDQSPQQDRILDFISYQTLLLWNTRDFFKLLTMKLLA